MNAHLSKLEREATEILGRLRRLQEISVPSACKLLGKSPKWVRANLPVIVHGPKSHHIRAVDIAAYQERRTLYPSNGKEQRERDHDLKSDAYENPNDL